MSDLVLLTRDGCVQTDRMRTRLDEALRALNLASDYQVMDLALLKADDARAGYPTPTLLYRGKDVFGMAQPVRPFPAPT
jgi:hypothetical protein